MKRLLGVAAIALALTGLLAGCAGHGRLASRVRPAGQVAVSTSSSASGSTGSNAGSTPKAKSPSNTTAQLATVQQQLTLLNSTMNSIDANITQADKAADSDNQ